MAKQKHTPRALTSTAVSKLPNVTKEEGFRTFGFTGADRGLCIKKYHEQYKKPDWIISYKICERIGRQLSINTSSRTANKQTELSEI